MKIYIASALPNMREARDLANVLRSAGRDVVSTWHDSDDSTPTREDALTRKEQAEIARTCLSEVCRCTHFVWLHGQAPGQVRFGAAIEYGAALASCFYQMRHEVTYTAMREVYAVDVTAPEQVFVKRAPSVFGALAHCLTMSALVEVLT